MTTIDLDVADLTPLSVTYTEHGSGRPVLLLHGGAGPQSVSAFAELLASNGFRVITPTHPGFGGTPRPASLSTLRGLAQVYGQLLASLGLSDVTVVGNSIGGWIAAEIALLGSPSVTRVVLADAAGLQVDSDPAADFFALTMDQVADLAYYRPDAFRIDVAALPEPARAIMAANQAALRVYAGTTMADPTLLDRLAAIDVPVLVVWGQADRMIPPAHGKAYAAAIPGASLTIIDDAGHLPQLETPGQLLKLVKDFHELTQRWDEPRRLVPSSEVAAQTVSSARSDAVSR